MTRKPKDLDYHAIFRKFNKLGIDYLVVGGLAVNLHGIPRMTYDIDIMILLQRSNILKLVTILTEWGYKPKVPVDPRSLADEVKRNAWMKEKSMKALNFYSESLSIGEIDLVFDSPIPYDQLRKRAVIIEIQGEKTPTVSIHDLIELKVHSGRKQDLADVDHLRIILER